MKRLGIAVAVVVGLALGLPLLMLVHARMTNPDVVQEVRANPTGERAAKVMLLTLPSARMIPVNFLLEDGRVYAGPTGDGGKNSKAGHIRSKFSSWESRSRGALAPCSTTRLIRRMSSLDSAPMRFLDSER